MSKHRPCTHILILLSHRQDMLQTLLPSRHHLHYYSGKFKRRHNVLWHTLRLIGYESCICWRMIFISCWKGRKGSDKYSHCRQDIFFWLGCETSQDEQGVAAIKAVELDELLGGSPVQHREVQGHESQDFLSAFPSGLIIRSGGVESGMRKVNHEHQTKLYRIAGGKYPMVIQV